MPMRIFVADYEGKTRDTLARLDFGLRLVVRVGVPGLHLLSDLEQFQPEMLIIGHSTDLPGGDLLRLKGLLQERWPDLKVILFGGDPVDLVENISRMDR